MSSSEDEDLSHLADCVYSVPVAQKSDKLPSQRHTEDTTQHGDYKSLKVSAAFQKHVSKHLETLLDTKSSFVSVKPKKKRRKCEENSGVLLLSCSETPLNAEEVQKTDKMSRPKKVQLDETELLKRAKLVAVSGEYVISRKEVEGWAPETRGQVEIVK